MYILLITNIIVGEQCNTSLSCILHVTASSVHRPDVTQNEAVHPMETMYRANTCVSFLEVYSYLVKTLSKQIIIIGASLNKPHAGVFNCNFSE